MRIQLGKFEASMLNPPTDGQVIDKENRQWNIRRTGSGNIILRSGFQSHPEFLPNGMSLIEFCQWINNHL